MLISKILVMLMLLWVVTGVGSGCWTEVVVVEQVLGCGCGSEEE